jgi:hypothetical protein
MPLFLEDLATPVFSVKFVVLEGVDIDVGAGSRSGRDVCKPVGRSVKPAHEMATRWERKEVRHSCKKQDTCKKCETLL